MINLMGRFIKNVFSKISIIIRHIYWRHVLSRKFTKLSKVQMINTLKLGVNVVNDDGILIDKNWRPIGVTDQFLDDAATYHERYFDRLDFEALLDRMLKLSGVDFQSNCRILDIGSGGGSSVFAALKLLPNSEVYASDISPPLLKMLANFAASKEELKNRIAAFCFDLHSPFFEKNTFDIVIGCAILHHLTDPFKALQNVVYSLKNGGKLVLCEPLEAGNLINLFIYDSVAEIERLKGSNQNKRLINLMKAMRLDIQARQGPPSEKPWTSILDDKWIFDASYLSELTLQLGCSTVEIFPAQENLEHVFETSFRSLLADSGNGDIKISDEIVAFLAEVDSEIIGNLKQKLCPTGIIVITK